MCYIVFYIMLSTGPFAFLCNIRYHNIDIIRIMVCIYVYVVYFFLFFDPEGLPYKFLVIAPEVDR